MDYTTPEERPILMSGPMVRAILEGRKTQTRRVVQWRPSSPADVSATRPPDEARPYTHITGAWLATWREPTGTSHMPTRCPYGSPGDTLWVRETWRTLAEYELHSPTRLPKDAPIWFDADDHERQENRRGDMGLAGNPPDWKAIGRGRPSIHMPRWASRLTLRVVSVRVERLRSITEEDARAEGVDPDPHPLSAAAWGGPHRLAFGRLWASINGARAPWASNPWVWVVTFSRVEVG